MNRTLAALILLAASIVLIPSNASAWVCRAVGFGSGGIAHSFSVEHAKWLALRRCERGAFLLCTIAWCRP
jgi:hypothetical protein